MPALATSTGIATTRRYGDIDDPPQVGEEEEEYPAVELMDIEALYKPVGEQGVPLPYGETEDAQEDDG